MAQLRLLDECGIPLEEREREQLAVSEQLIDIRVEKSQQNKTGHSC